MESLLVLIDSGLTTVTYFVFRKGYFGLIHYPNPLGLAELSGVDGPGTHFHSVEDSDATQCYAYAYKTGGPDGLKALLQERGLTVS